MTATVLDPRTALVVVDLQKGIVALPTAHPAEDVVANSAAPPTPSAPRASRSSWFA